MGGFAKSLIPRTGDACSEASLVIRDEGTGGGPVRL